jgi:hypothetical protein
MAAMDGSDQYPPETFAQAYARALPGPLQGADATTGQTAESQFPRPEPGIPWWAWVLGGALVLMWLDRRLEQRGGRLRNPDEDDDEEDDLEEDEDEP